MKIVVTAISPDIASAVDPRFGRGAQFLFVDTETMEWQALANPAVSAAGGAGTQAAQYIASQGAQAVISGDFGPNAHMALSAAGIPMYLCDAGSTVADTVRAFKAGELRAVQGPTGPAAPFWPDGKINPCESR